MFCNIVPSKHTHMSEQIFKFMQSADTSGNPFVKLQDGETIQLRILSQPLTGWEQFADGRPHRWPADQNKPEGTPQSDERARPFLAFVVYVYTGDAGVKIWQFTQQTIIRQMEVLFQGGALHWSSFMLNLHRKGAGMDTTWTVIGTQVPLEDSLIEFATKSKDYIDLNALFIGDSPIIQPLPSISVDRTDTAPSDNPF